MPCSITVAPFILTLTIFTSCVFTAPPPSSFRRATTDPFSYAPGFDIQKVASVAESLPSHSWEYGTAVEMLLELYNPELSVFGDAPFDQKANSFDGVKALTYAKSHIVLNLADAAGANVLIDGDGATGDPASLGSSAVMLGKSDDLYKEAAERTMGYLVGTAPRYWNGAISQRADVAELWADFIYMAPPFLAYYAVDTSNSTLLYEAVQQCSAYRQILQQPALLSPTAGLWQHIVGPQSADPGLWSTGNAWAAAGMTRVLATVTKAPEYLFESLLASKAQIIGELTGYIQEIIDGALGSSFDGGLLRNYMNDDNSFGEISGTTLIASVVYRMAVLQPSIFYPSSTYVTFANSVLSLLGSEDSTGEPHISSGGIAQPVVNPLNWFDPVPITAVNGTGSPEGQNFVVLMYAAWRDCVSFGICSENY